MPSPTALVTGATSGIGRATAIELLTRGWEVWIAGRDSHRVEAAAAELGGRALLVDVTDPVGVAAAARRVSELDVLVNNAGVSPEPSVPLAESDAELFRRTYETNVFGVVTVTNAFLPLLRRSHRPRIVNVSSGTGSLTWSTGPNPQFDHHQAAANGGRLAAYRSSKTALNALTLFYAQALADDGIKVNALAPGVRATNLNPAAAARGGDPAEAADAVVDLATLADDGPTGQFFSYDGTPVPW
ncbi:MAG: SDR family NAD(P)-dependent oxidoreductase [Acidobacteriota bacterium]|nr:SDR family NAD(P)-dependent oxidoreductase [Acidobacteriota bacterium]